MDSEAIHELFEEHNNEFLRFDEIPADQKRHVRPDVCAFIYLHERFEKKNALGSYSEAVGGAAHDEIWLAWNSDDLSEITSEDVLYLSRCGVRWDEEADCLAMFV
jgi:hypothetical protein